jgi:hypothetical protein
MEEEGAPIHGGWKVGERNQSRNREWRGMPCYTKTISLLIQHIMQMTFAGDIGRTRSVHENSACCLRLWWILCVEEGLHQDACIWRS